jgi:hypothetical protein
LLHINRLVARKTAYVDSLRARVVREEIEEGIRRRRLRAKSSDTIHIKGRNDNVPPSSSTNALPSQKRSRDEERKQRRDQSEDETIERESQESDDSREESVHGTELAGKAGQDTCKLDAEERASNMRLHEAGQHWAGSLMMRRTGRKGP